MQQAAPMQQEAPVDESQLGFVMPQ